MRAFGMCACVVGEPSDELAGGTGIRALLDEITRSVDEPIPIITIKITFYA